MRMRTALREGILELYPEGHVDSKNAAEFERDVMSAVEAAPGASVVVDVDKLDYVSSAGLRVFMKAMRRPKSAPSAKLRLRNSSSRARI